MHDALGRFKSVPISAAWPKLRREQGVVVEIPPEVVGNAVLAGDAVIEFGPVDVLDVGQGIAIAVRPDHATPSDDELRGLIKDRLRSSRVPEQIRVVETLPYNEMGKLLRREVRTLFSS